MVTFTIKFAVCLRLSCPACPLAVFVLLVLWLCLFVLVLCSSLVFLAKEI